MVCRRLIWLVLSLWALILEWSFGAPLVPNHGGYRAFQLMLSAAEHITWDDFADAAPALPSPLAFRPQI